MAKLFWPTHEELRIPFGKKNVPVELHGLLVLSLMVSRKAAVRLDDWVLTRPALVSLADGSLLEGIPLYLTWGSLKKLIRAGLVRRADEETEARILAAALERDPWEKTDHRNGPGLDAFVATEAGKREVEAHAARIDGEMWIGMTKPELYVVAGAARGSDGRAVGTGPLCSVLTDRGGMVEVRVVSMPPAGRGLLVSFEEIQRLKRAAIVLWDSDPEEWRRLLAPEVERVAARSAEDAEHARLVAEEAARHLAAVGDTERRWREAVVAATGEEPSDLVLTGRKGGAILD